MRITAHTSRPLSALAFVTDPSLLTPCNDPALLAYSPILSSPPPPGDHKPVPHFSFSRLPLSSEVLVPRIGASAHQGRSGGAPAWWRDRDDEGVVWRGKLSALSTPTRDTILSASNATTDTAWRLLTVDNMEAEPFAPLGVSYVDSKAVQDAEALGRGDWTKEKILDVALSLGEAVACDQNDEACSELVSLCAPLAHP